MTKKIVDKICKKYNISSVDIRGVVREHRFYMNASCVRWAQRGQGRVILFNPSLPKPSLNLAVLIELVKVMQILHDDNYIDIRLETLFSKHGGVWW